MFSISNTSIAGSPLGRLTIGITDRAGQRKEIVMQRDAQQPDRLVIQMPPATYAPVDDDIPEYDPDCPLCLRDLTHTLSEHFAALDRNDRASDPYPIEWSQLDETPLGEQIDGGNDEFYL